GLQEDRVGHADLAQVVQQEAVLERRIGGEPGRDALREEEPEAGDAGAVAPARPAAQLERRGGRAEQTGARGPPLARSVRGGAKRLLACRIVHRDARASARHQTTRSLASCRKSIPPGGDVAITARQGRRKSTRAAIRDGGADAPPSECLGRDAGQYRAPR